MSTEAPPDPGRKRPAASLLQTSSQVLLSLAGTALLLAPVGLWFGSGFMLLAAGSGEYRAIQDTGLPACVEVLEWSDWVQGSGGLKPSHIRDNIDPKAEIVAYRIASKSAIATEYTFYQARYRLPDGSFRVDHADGPRPLIDQNWTILYASLGIGIPAAFLLFIAATRVGRTR